MQMAHISASLFCLFSMNCTCQLRLVSLFCLAAASAPLSSICQTSLSVVPQPSQDFAPTGVINVTQVTATPTLASDMTKGVKGKGVITSSQGPWGRLEYFPVFMEAPLSLVNRFPIPSSRPRWAFPSSFLPHLNDFLTNAGMDQSVVNAMLASDAVVSEGDMAYVFPPLSVLETMTSLQRTVVYAELRKIPANEFHAEPVLITSGDVDEWFRSSKLRPEIISKIKLFTYERGDTLAFSDLPAVMNYAQGEEEARAIVKAFTRTRALIVKLLIEDKADIKTVMDYWTTGLNLRRKDMEPMLESIVDVGAERLDIAHMLPPLPRKLLMTYPDTGMAKEGIFPDCHWTSLNFFNYNAQPYLLDSRLATTAVLERFNPVEPPFKFGDILFFLDSARGDAFHSCVYIADDIVFTKNGRNVLSPWIFAKLEDVKKVYLFDNNGRIQGYRNKNAPPVVTDESDN